MATYYVNKNGGERGEHEVHKEECIWVPAAWNRVQLGWCSSSEEAVVKAKAIYPTADSCKRCAPARYTR